MSFSKKSTNDNTIMKLSSILGLKDKDKSKDLVVERELLENKKNEIIKMINKIQKTSHEGYLTKKGIAVSNLFGDPWARRFFVLKEGNLFYYKNKMEYERGEDNSIKNRPIILLGYSVTKTINNEQPYSFNLQVNFNVIFIIVIFFLLLFLYI